MRIDNLAVGSEITLRFHGSNGNQTHEETFIFRGISGEGDERRATFQYSGNVDDVWEAYRYNGRWAYGSSADRLSIVR
jgi:hypothetical protein